MYRPSREIIGAWVFCGLVGLGTLMLGGTGNPATAVYPGAGLPPHAGSLASGLSIADQFAEDAIEAADDLPVPEPSSTQPGRQVAEVTRCWLKLARHFL